MVTLDSNSNVNSLPDLKTVSELMICGTQPNKLWKMLSILSEDPGNLTLEMELSMDQRLTLRSRMPSTDTISAVPSKPISNFLLDSTYNIKAKMPPQFKNKQLPTKKYKTIKKCLSKFSQLMKTTIKNSFGKKENSNPVSKDLSSYIELLWDLASVSLLF